LYQDKLDGLLRDGDARMIPADEESKPHRIWLIPHHSCIAADKLRVVHACPVTFRGTSLSDNLLQDRDLTNALLGVLLVFRLP